MSLLGPCHAAHIGKEGFNSWFRHSQVSTGVGKVTNSIPLGSLYNYTIIPTPKPCCTYEGLVLVRLQGAGSWLTCAYIAPHAVRILQHRLEPRGQGNMVCGLGHRSHCKRLRSVQQGSSLVNTPIRDFREHPFRIQSRPLWGYNKASSHGSHKPEGKFQALWGT